MPQGIKDINERDDVRLDKYKDTSDILISYVLLLPTILGLVRAKTSGELKKYQDKITDLLSSDDISNQYSGQRLRAQAAKRAGRGDEVDNVATELLSKTEGRTSNKLSAKDVARNIATRRTLLSEISSEESQEIRSVLEGRRNKAKRLRQEIADRITARAKYRPDIWSQISKQSPHSIADELAFRALAFATDVYVDPTASVDAVRKSLGVSSLNLDEINDPKVLRRYTNKLTELSNKFFRGGDLRAPSRSPNQTVSAFLQVRTSETLLSNGRSGSQGPLDAIEQSLRRSRAGGRDSPVTADKLERAIKAHQRLSGINNLQTVYESQFSPRAQARSIYELYQNVTKTIGRLSKNSAPDGVWAGSGVDLVVDYQQSFGYDAKYFKILIKTRKGKPLELPVPSVQLGHVYTRPGILPVNVPLMAESPTMTGIQHPASKLTLMLHEILDHVRSDYQETLDPSFSSESWMRVLEELPSSGSQATFTSSDILRQHTVANQAIKLASGQGTPLEYRKAAYAKSILSAIRRANTLADTRLFAFDTEFMSPRGYTNKALGSKMIEDSGVRIWQLGFEMIDPASKKAVLDSSEKTLLIRPDNWEEIADDVKSFLRDKMSDVPSEERERRISNLVKDMDELAGKEKKSLIDALKAIEKRLQGRTYVLGQNQTAADVRVLLKHMDAVLSAESAKEWKMRLAPLFNADLLEYSGSQHRHIDVFRFWQGYTLGEKIGASNDTIFRNLYGGRRGEVAGMELFGTILNEARRIGGGGKFLTDKEQVSQIITQFAKPGKGFAIKDTVSNEFIENTWQAYKQFLYADFDTKGLNFSAHTEARYDVMITAMNFFKLMDRELNPSLEDTQRLIRLDDAAEVYRRKQTGGGIAWDTLHQLYERAEYEHAIREPLYELYDSSLIDQRTGMLLNDEYYRLDVFDVTHGQAAKGRAGLLQIERMVPGGLLNNVLRTKYQVFSAKMLSINPVKIMDAMKLGQVAKPGAGGNPYSQATITTNNPYSTVAGNEFRLGFRKMAELWYGKKSSWENQFSMLADNIRVPTLLLPDTVNLVNDGKQYIRKELADSLLIHGHGAISDQKYLSIDLPMDLASKQRDKNIGDLLRRMEFDPRLAQAFDKAELFDKETGELVKGIRESLPLDDGRPITLRPGQRIFGGGALPERKDQLFRGKVPGEIANLQFDASAGKLYIQVSAPSPVYAGTKGYIGETGISKGTIHSVMQPGTFGRFMYTAGYKLGGSRNELGALLEIQMNRILDKVYTTTDNLGEQQRLLADILTPLFGKHIAGVPGRQDPVMPAVKISAISRVTDAGDTKTIAQVLLTDKGQQLLYERAGDPLSNPLFKALETAGIDYDYTRKQFMDMARDALDSEVDAKNMWDQAVQKERRALEVRITKLQTKLSSVVTNEESKALHNEIAFYGAQLETLKKRVGAMLFDPAISRIDTGRGELALPPIVAFESFIAGMQIRFLETAPYDYTKPMGIGASKTSPYNAMVIRNMIRTLDPERKMDLAQSIEKYLDNSMGGRRVTEDSPYSPAIRKNLQAAGVAVQQFVGGERSWVPEPIKEVLSKEELARIYKLLNASKQIPTADFLSQMGIHVSGAIDDWRETIQRELAKRPDLDLDLDKIEGIIESKKGIMLRSSEIKDISLFKPSDKATADALRVKIPQLGRKERRAAEKLIKSLEGSLKMPAEAVLGNIQFDLSRDVLNKLSGNVDNELLKAVISRRGLGNLDSVTLNEIVLPKLTGLFEPYEFETSVGGQMDKWRIAGGMQRRTLELVSSIHQFGEAQERVIGLASRVQRDQTSLNAKIVEEATDALRTYASQKRALTEQIQNDLYQRILAPSMALAVHKAYSSYMPISYGKLFGHSGTLPAFSRIYQSIALTKQGDLKGFDVLTQEFGAESLKQINKARTAEIAELLSTPKAQREFKRKYAYDINQALFNLLDPKAKPGSMLGEEGEVLVRGLGMNQSIIPYSHAKALVKTQITNRGGVNAEVSDEFARWLRGEAGHIIGITREPVSRHNYYGLGATYVVPDELLKLMGWAKDPDILNAAVFIDDLTKVLIDADWDGDIGSLTYMGKNVTSDAADLMNRQTDVALKRLVAQNMRKHGTASNPYMIDLGEYQVDVNKAFEEIAEAKKADKPKIVQVSLAIKDRHASTSIIEPDQESLIPKRLFTSMAEEEYNMLRSGRVDAYLTQKLATGVIGAGHKFYMAQAMGYENSAYSQLAEYASKNIKDVNKVIHQAGLSDKRYILDASMIQSHVDYLHNPPGTGTGLPVIARMEHWSGTLMQETGIVKKRNLMESTRDLVTRQLRAAKTFIYPGDPSKQVNLAAVEDAIQTLVHNPDNPELSWAYEYYNPEEYGKKAFHELAPDEYKKVRKEAEAILRADFALRTIGSRVAPIHDFRTRFLQSAAQGDEAILMSLVQEDYDVASAITHAVPMWAKHFMDPHGAKAALRSLSSDSPLFSRESAVEFLQQRAKKLFASSESPLARNRKWASIAVLGFIALNPNANKMILGDTPGRGGEEYDFPKLSAIFRAHRRPPVLTSEFPADFTDKINKVTGLPVKTMTQLRRDNSEDLFPSIVSSTYNRNARQYNRLNIDQLINAANQVLP